MTNRSGVVSVDTLWDIFDRERDRAQEGVDAPVGLPAWNIAAGKIDVINNTNCIPDGKGGTVMTNEEAALLLDPKNNRDGIEKVWRRKYAD